MGEQQPRFALPGDWWRIALTDSPAAIAGSVKRFVEQRAGTADDRAQFRALMREHLMSSVQEASQADARAMYFSAEIAPGVPIAITLTTYHPDLPPRLSWEAGIEAAAESFAASLHELQPDALVGVWAEEDVAVVREVRLSILTAPSGDQEANLRADYWLFSSGGSRPWLFSFGSPLVWEEELEPLVGMLDAIVATVTWQPDADQDALTVSPPA